MLLVGAALSTSSSLVQYVLSSLRSLLIDTVKRMFVYTAIFDGRDETYRWLLLYMTMHPNFEKASQFEVTKDPSFAKDDQADRRVIYTNDLIHMKEAPKLLSLPKVSNDTTKKRSTDYFLTPANQQVLHFIHEGTHFWASRQRNEIKGGGFSEHLALSYLSLSASEPLRSLLDHARVQYQKYLAQRLTYHRLDRHGHWDAPLYKSKRSADTVHLPEDKKQLILQDAKSFFTVETQQKYQDRNIPWRRGYFFHGPPGTGKSTLCHVLASELCLPVYEINFNNRSLDDTTFVKVMSRIPLRSIILVEDIDAAFVKRDLLTKAQKEAGSYTSFSAFLNAIDGVGASEGRLLCITTNHKERLDPALMRSGRIDLEIEFSNATKHQAKEMFLRFFSPKGPSSSTIEMQAEAFAQSASTKKCTVSTLQNYLLLKMDDPKSAVEGIDAWLSELDEHHNSQVQDEKTLDQ